MEYICANCRNPVKVTPSVRLPNHQLVVDECEHCFNEMDEQRAGDIRDLEREMDSLSDGPDRTDPGYWMDNF